MRNLSSWCRWRSPPVWTDKILIKISQNVNEVVKCKSSVLKSPQWSSCIEAVGRSAGEIFLFIIVLSITAELFHILVSVCRPTRRSVG
jgi:hypothetical protein